MPAEWSPPSRGAWIEIQDSFGGPIAIIMSPPSRGAWIEISMKIQDFSGKFVAPLAGGVD